MKFRHIAAAPLCALTICAAMLTGSLGDEAVRAYASPQDTKALAAAEDPYSALRLHVIAASDDPSDQAAKLRMRDAVLARMKEGFDEAEVSTPGEAEELLTAMGGEIQAAAEKALNDIGRPQNVQLEVGEFDFPLRVYQNTVYPAGRYRALRVIIGQGCGHNWWCVMFPPLCIIESEEAPAQYNEDGTLEFKSLISELWERIFG